MSVTCLSFCFFCFFSHFFFSTGIVKFSRMALDFLSYNWGKIHFFLMAQTALSLWKGPRFMSTASTFLNSGWPVFFKPSGPWFTVCSFPVGRWPCVESTGVFLDVFPNCSCLYYSVSLPLYINTKAWFPTLCPSVAQWLKKTGPDEPRPHHRSVSANHVTLCKSLNLFELVSSSVNMMQVPLP